MEDYKKLVNRLRDEPKDSRKAVLSIYDLCIDAAYAIEILLDKLKYAEGERDAVTRHMIELEQDVCRLKSRLAAYEDTGLEPEEIKVHEAAKYNAGYYHGDEDRCRWIEKELGPIDHLRDLLQAEKEGRLVVLPCKVGDTVYMPVGKWGTITGYEADECDGFHIARDGVLQIKAKCYSGNYGTYGVPGKTVFLTREEAEAALKGGDG